jgi:hypothetical protein
LSCPDIIFGRNTAGQRLPEQATGTDRGVVRGRDLRGDPAPARLHVAQVRLAEVDPGRQCLEAQTRRPARGAEGLAQGITGLTDRAI